MAEITEINSSLAKGVVGSFESAYQDLCKLALLSTKYEWIGVPEADSARIMFCKIDENSDEQDISEFLRALKKIPSQKLDFECDYSIKDFCARFRRLRDSVERKLSTKSNTWLEIREKEKTFKVEEKTLSKELKDLEDEFERTRLQRHRQVEEEATKKETTQRLLSAAEDFKSQHPFYLKANTNEQLEFIETFNEKKLAKLREDLENAEKKYLDATSMNQIPIQRVIEETMQTKAFIHWLKQKNRSKLKSFQEELEQLWNRFKEEIQHSEELCIKYKEINELATRIVTEKKRKEYVKNRLAATLTIQKHFRLYLARKKEEKEY